MPSDLKELFRSTINNPTKEGRDRLVDSLNQLWKPFIADDFIKNIIANLAIKYIYKLKLNHEEVESAVSSFLLLTDSDLTRNITSNILNNMRNSHA